MRESHLVVRVAMREPPNLVVLRTNSLLLCADLEASLEVKPLLDLQGKYKMRSISNTYMVDLEREQRKNGKSTDEDAMCTDEFNKEY
ncbi:hypothetical protein FOCC_FOCC011482, partial [Frankliniella occidentalis]